MKNLDKNFLIKEKDKDINKEPTLSLCRVFVSFHRVVIKFLKKFGITGLERIEIVDFDRLIGKWGFCVVAEISTL